MRLGHNSSGGLDKSLEADVQVKAMIEAVD